VTTAIIGPRTIEHLESSRPRISSLTRRCSTASTKIVAPGINLNPADAGELADWTNPAVEPAARRR
jgi:hypothetical protein